MCILSIRHLCVQETNCLIEAVLDIRIPELWVTPLTEKYDVEVSCQIGGHSTKTGWGIVTIRGDDSAIDKMVEEMSGHPSVGKVQVKDRQPGVVSLLVDVVRCRACKVLVTSKAFMVLSSRYQKGANEVAPHYGHEQNCGKTLRSTQGG